MTVCRRTSGEGLSETNSQVALLEHAVNTLNHTSSPSRYFGIFPGIPVSGELSTEKEKVFGV